MAQVAALSFVRSTNDILSVRACGLRMAGAEKGQHPTRATPHEAYGGVALLSTLAVDHRLKIWPSLLYINALYVVTC